jgi:branched-chain amino acid aminotransferase
MPTSPAWVWWQHRLVPWDEATVHVSELGWSAVGAVFEGVRAYWNDEHGELYVFRLEEHCNRLLRSARAVRLPLPYSAGELADVTIAVLRANDAREDTYVFPLAYPLEADDKRFDPRDLRGELVVTTKPMPTRLGRGVTYHGKVSSWTRISDNVMPPRVKSLANYRNSQLATFEVKQDGYDVAFLLNTAGKLSEAGSASVFLVRDGRLITPDLNSDILEGINRDAVITLAVERLGVDVVERPVDRTELYAADEIFICGTAVEITPVVSIDRFTVGEGRPGPLTRQLEDLLAAVMRGTDAGSSRWRTAAGVMSPAAAAASGGLDG